MDVMTYSDARAQLKGVMDRAIVDGQEVVVTRKKGEAVGPAGLRRPRSAVPVQLGSWPSRWNASAVVCGASRAKGPAKALGLSGRLGGAFGPG